MNKERLTLLQKRLEDIRTIKNKGILMRARSKWIEDGEKNTKYFCNLEKKHVCDKTIPFIEKEDGSKIFDRNDILQETSNFYKTLYTKQILMEDFDIKVELENCRVNKLSVEQANKLEGLLTFDEVSYTLKHMQNDRSPGSDGFTANFFKVFWTKIGHFVVRAINEAFISDSFSRNMKLGVITCIPKDNKPKICLKNLRPLTLLNTIYKLASGSIANRLKTTLDFLISKEQSGFSKGRYIGENTRLLYDIY